MQGPRVPLCRAVDNTGTGVQSIGNVWLTRINQVRPKRRSVRAVDDQQAVLHAVSEFGTGLRHQEPGKTPRLRSVPAIDDNRSYEPNGGRCAVGSTNITGSRRSAATATETISQTPAQKIADRESRLMRDETA